MRSARAGPKETLAPFIMTGAGIAAPGQPGRRAAARSTSGTHVAACLSIGIGMAYVPPEKAEPGTPIEIDVRGKARAAEVRTKPLYTKETLNRGRGELSRRPQVPPRARLGAHRRRRAPRSGSPGTHRTSWGRSCSSTRRRSASPLEQGPAVRREIESVKAVSDGRGAGCRARSSRRPRPWVTRPRKINEDPYGDGWLVKVRLSDTSEVEELLDREAYEGSLSS